MKQELSATINEKRKQAEVLLDSIIPLLKSFGIDGKTISSRVKSKQSIVEN